MLAWAWGARPRAMTKPVYLLLEQKENLRAPGLRDAMWELLALAVKSYGHGFSTLSRLGHDTELHSERVRRAGNGAETCPRWLG
jgi:hypothetical protein